MSKMTYAICRYLLIGPALHAYGRPRYLGRHLIPAEGPVILAANHLAVADSFYLALAARRPVSFLAKSEYFTGSGVWGSIQRKFFRALDQIPVDRSSEARGSTALSAACSILVQGGAWGIHPEGTRSPTGDIYRGHTGAVRVSLLTGVPLIPVAITGTGCRTSVFRRLRRRVTVTVLPPLDLSSTHLADESSVRAATDSLMATIASASGQQYVDRYARNDADPTGVRRRRPAA